MKLNKVAVIANFPYQMNDGGGTGSSAKPIYHLFIESVIDNIKPDHFVSINPSRWMLGGKGLDKHRERMMNDRRMKKIVHFAGDREVFNTVSIAGGVNFFAWEKDYNGECEFVADNIPSKRFLNKYDIIIQDNSALTILDKVLNSGKSNVGQMCFSQNTFDLRSNFTEWDDVGVKVITAGRKEKFVNSDKFSDKNGIIGKYKVCTSKANGAAQEDKGDGKRVISDAFVIDPSEICNETYLVVNTFDSKRDAENFALFMKTKFFRFMMALRTPTQNISRNCFDWVPDMKDYSTVWTDKELYKEFGLGTQEIKYIERKIKAI